MIRVLILYCAVRYHANSKVHNVTIGYVIRSFSFALGVKTGELVNYEMQFFYLWELSVISANSVHIWKDRSASCRKSRSF